MSFSEIYYVNSSSSLGLLVYIYGQWISLENAFYPRRFLEKVILGNGRILEIFQTRPIFIYFMKIILEEGHHA